MKRSLFVFVFLFLSIKLIPAPYDSGMITWRQPDGITTFTAQLHGDEFSMKFNTRDGYEIKEGTGGWFYYAILDGSGNIVPGNLKVGIDSPPSISLNLQPSPEVQSEIDQRKLDFQQQLLEAEAWYKQKREESNGGPVTLKIGVILVDFEDQPVHYQSDEFPNGYPTHFFNDMLFSQNTYIDQSGTNNKHPEKKKVFGSLRDFLNQQSCGKLDIVGKIINGVGQPQILNPPDLLHPDVPQWVYLSGTNNSWNNTTNGLLGSEEVENKAISMGIQLKDINGINIYDRLIFIYAGETIWGAGGKTGLTPATNARRKFQMSERWEDSDLNEILFSHIGTYCHEFMHLLGAGDQYGGNIDANYWDLMSGGSYNGPQKTGGCPAGMNPYYRTKWDWVIPAYPINIDPITYTILYNYATPNYYRLDDPYTRGQYFLVENRGRVGFDEYTPNHIDFVSPSTIDPNIYDINGNQGGLLIWTIDEYATPGDEVGLISAFFGSVPCSNQGQGAFDPFPFHSNDNNGSGENLTENTIPNNKIRINKPSSKINFTNIIWDDVSKNISVNISRNFSADYEVISGNTSWNTSRIINKDLLVMPNSTLTVQPGVTLQFDPQKKIILSNKATLKTESFGSPIILKNYSTAKWGGIELCGEGSDLISLNLIIQNATIGITIPDGMNRCIKNIKFLQNSSALSTFGSKLDSFNVDIRNCKFDDTPFSYISSGSSGGELIMNFYNNSFYNNWSLLGQGAITLNLINNDFKGGGGAYITLPEGRLNNIKNNIFYQTGISNSTPSNSSIFYNCVYPYTTNPSLFSGNGNFLANPLFAEPGILESQSLQQSSPCIDMGDPTMDYNNEPGTNGGRINIGSLGNTTLATVATPNTSRNLSAINMLGNLSLSQSSNWSVNSRNL